MFLAILKFHYNISGSNSWQSIGCRALALQLSGRPVTPAFIKPPMVGRSGSFGTVLMLTKLHACTDQSKAHNSTHAGWSVMLACRLSKSSVSSVAVDTQTVSRHRSIDLSTVLYQASVLLSDE